MDRISPIPLVLGIGNELRRDDGAGIAAARLLARQFSDRVDIREMSGEGTALMEAWRNRSFVVLIDAVAGVRPGWIHRFAVPGEIVPFKFFHYSSHHFSVAEAIEMSRQLGTLPDAVRVFGIEAKDFDYGQGLSPVVREAVHNVVNELRGLLIPIIDPHR